jgi:hypothetical protein
MKLHLQFKAVSGDSSRVRPNIPLVILGLSFTAVKGNIYPGSRPFGSGCAAKAAAPQQNAVDVKKFHPFRF